MKAHLCVKQKNEFEFIFLLKSLAISHNVENIFKFNSPEKSLFHDVANPDENHCF